MAYYSPYQPQMDQQQLNKMGSDIGRNIVEKTIIYGAQAIKFLVQFVIDAARSIVGK